MSRQVTSAQQPSQLKIALVHDYLREYGGAERVLEVLHELFPEAPVYTAFADKKAMGVNWQRFATWDIRESAITRFPLYKKLFSPLRVFAKWAFEQFDLSSYDLIISSSNAYFAKAARARAGRHLCYCHTPPRVLYGYSAKSNWRANPYTRFAGNLLNHVVRQQDFKAGQNPDLMIANSAETALRIKKFYKRDSVVIHPPIMVFEQAAAFFKNLDKPGLEKLVKHKHQSYYLYVNRLALAKHPELAVQAANTLGIPLKVVGTGSMLADLQKLALPNIEFLGGVDDQQLMELYQNARALIYPAVDEDFGMVPVEAMAFGTPVIAHRSGGPKETIREGQTGVFFDELSESALVAAIKTFERTFVASPLAIHQATKAYSVGNFTKQITTLIVRQLSKLTN
jgi:glycosyltransferase involved in cell wall biosynthesis